MFDSILIAPFYMFYSILIAPFNMFNSALIAPFCTFSFRKKYQMCSRKLEKNGKQNYANFIYAIIKYN